MEAATLWIAFVSAVATCGAAVFAGFAMANASRAQDDAASAAARAEEAESQAIEAWRSTATALEQANEQERRAARAPFGAAITEIGHSMLNARASGFSDKGEFPGQIEQMQALRPLQFATGSSSTWKLSRWVSEFARSTPIEDVSSVLRAISLVSERVLRWVDDPDAAMKAIRADPRIVSDRLPSPDDSADWRAE